MKRLRKLSLVALFVINCGTEEPTPAGQGGQVGTKTGGSGGTSSGGSGGNGGSMGGAGGAPLSNEYFPFKVGNSWEYNVTEPGRAAVTKVHRIVRAEVVGGTGPNKDKQVFRVETQKRPDATPADATISWQLRDGDRVMRYREQSCNGGSLELGGDGSVTKCTVNEEAFWTPGRIRLDEKPTGMALAKGLSWMQEYDESKTTFDFRTAPPTATTVTGKHVERWEVTESGQTVMVPAGTFTNCVVIKKTSQTDSAKTYTFCKGVGKVKEEGTVGGQTETLIKHTLL